MHRCKGCRGNEPENNRKLSHTAASARIDTIFSVDANGKLTGGSIQELFDAIDKPPFHPSPEAQSVIVRVDIVGTAASARIDSNDVSGFSFSDFFQLLKVDGKWTIVSKIFYTHAAP
ncbi:nuclear transport factor 2 family protein [Undibacterium sp. CY21W]|uniref:nuclear transport factor 2 family protein n=1 Tax=unclassified Undibacterium TaxID=2630295 RepID=UPI00351AFF2D